MSEAPTSNPATAGAYENYEKQADARHRLYMKGAHKALDIPEDMGDITSSTTNKSGLGWKELGVLAAAGLGAGHLLSGGETAPTTPAPPPAAVAPVDSDYVVSFWQQQADGKYKLVEVPRLPPGDRRKIEP